MSPSPTPVAGSRFVYDQHDICPELYIAKFNRRGIGHAITRICEWLSYRCADLVITANESFKTLCSPRNGKNPKDVVAIHSYPDFAKFAAVAAQPNAAGDGRLTIGYVGIIGSQDGVDTLVRAIDVLRTERGRYARDRLALAVPVVGVTIQFALVERFCRVFGSMISAGVALPEALRVTSGSLRNRVYARALALEHRPAGGADGAVPADGHPDDAGR
jgi:hypothetical protein